MLQYFNDARFGCLREENERIFSVQVIPDAPTSSIANSNVQYTANELTRGVSTKAIINLCANAMFRYQSPHDLYLSSMSIKPRITKILKDDTNKIKYE